MGDAPAVKAGEVADDQVVLDQVAVGVFTQGDTAGTLEAAVFVNLVMLDVNFRVLETSGVETEVVLVEHLETRHPAHRRKYRRRNCPGCW